MAFNPTYKLRIRDKTVSAVGDIGMLREYRYTDFLMASYQGDTGLAQPAVVRFYRDWADVEAMPRGLDTACLVVGGGRLTRNLDLGYSVVVNCDGVLDANLRCGRYFAPSGRSLSAFERLLPQPCRFAFAHLGRLLRLRPA